MTESERLLRQLSRTSDPVEALAPPMSVRHRDYEPPQALVKPPRKWGFQASNIRRNLCRWGALFLPLFGLRCRNGTDGLLGRSRFQSGFYMLE
jgi:hypothetical protein